MDAKAWSRNKEPETSHENTHTQNIIEFQDHHHLAYVTLSFMLVAINKSII